MASEPSRKSLSVAILGCGNMGSALLHGILTSAKNTNNPVNKYYACVQRPTSAERLRVDFSRDNEFVEIVCNDNGRAISAADVIILGFQPGDVNTILNADVTSLMQGKLIISMLAGVSCKTISDLLGPVEPEQQSHRVVRVMPSIGVLVNQSVTLISESQLDEDSENLVKWLVGNIGTVETVSEDMMNTAVAVSAASHALTVTAVDALTDGSVSRGLPRATALKITAQCLRSAATTLLEKMTLEELKDSMSVPRGITTESWIHLEAGGIRSAISQAVRQAVDYAEAMEQSGKN